MNAQKPFPALLALAGAGMIFALVAAKCESDVTYPPYVAEVCGDNKDNDSDGKADCDDVDCKAACKVEVTINQPPRAESDSIKVSGTSVRAASVAISVSPSGQGGQATLQGNGSWEFHIKGITQKGATHTVTAVATSSGGLTDSASATFERSP